MYFIVLLLLGGAGGTALRAGSFILSRRAQGKSTARRTIFIQSLEPSREKTALRLLPGQGEKKPGNVQSVPSFTKGCAIRETMRRTKYEYVTLMEEALPRIYTFKSHFKGSR
jgi:hypothetical protein